MSSLNKTPLVIAVTGGKGGVGKSNVALNLSLALQQANKKVVLLDADLGLANIDVLLGLSLKKNLSHVLSGQCQLNDVIVTSQEGLSIVPAGRGDTSMADLSELQLHGLIHEFSKLKRPMDYLVIDTATGLSKSVGCFAVASHEIIIVVCDEPTALTDAYASIKVLHQDYGINRFQVLVNRVHHDHEAQSLYYKLDQAVETFLTVATHYLGYIPQDDLLREAVQQQEPVVLAYPNSRCSCHFKQIANTVKAWHVPITMRGQLEFFLEDRMHQSKQHSQIGWQDE